MTGEAATPNPLALTALPTGRRVTNRARQRGRWLRKLTRGRTRDDKIRPNIPSSFP
jgi:hypothetical protein